MTQPNPLSPFILPLLLTIPLAQADTSPCNGLLSLGVYNTTQRTDADRANALLQSKFCAADFNTITETSYKAGSSANTQILEIEASYDLLTNSLASGVSDAVRRTSIIQKQTQLCKGNFNGEDYLKTASSEAWLAYQGALEAWNQCNIANGKGLRFEAKPSSNLQGFTVDLSITDSGRPHNFKGLTLEGGNATCTTQLAPRNSSSINGKLITVDASTRIELSNAITSITCKREMLDDGMGTNGKSAEATGLHFHTSAGTVVVPLAAIGKVPRVEYDKAVADVKLMADQKFTELSKSLQETDGKVTTLQGNVSVIDSSLNTFKGKFKTTYIIAGECPSGWEDVGVIGVIYLNGNPKPPPWGGGDFNGSWRWTHPRLCKFIS